MDSVIATVEFTPAARARFVEFLTAAFDQQLADDAIEKYELDCLAVLADQLNASESLIWTVRTTHTGRLLEHEFRCAESDLIVIDYVE